MNFQTLKDYFQEFIECNQHKIMFLNGKDDIFEEFKVIDAINFLEEKDKEIERLKTDLHEANDSVTWWQNRANASERDKIYFKKGYCELKEKCNKGECDCTHEEYNNMCEQNIKMDLEIERLNNIINELEKELDRGYLDLFEHELVPGRELIINIKNYLQELKGSDKE